MKTILTLLTCLALAGLARPVSAQTDKDAQWRGMLAAPKVFRAAAAKIEPSLVTIESFGGVSTKQGQIGGIRKQGEGNTTGVMISADGFVITSLFNFIQQPSVITVITSDGVRRRAWVKGKDKTRNLCVLKIEGIDGQVVPEMVSPEDVQVGQWAVSIGVGYGDKNPAVSAGIISAKHRIGGRAIQTDANISPANYGGPLVDIEGRLIGICVPLAPGATSIGAGVEWYDSGIGFAIPLRGNESLIERLKNGETIEPGYIGVRPEFVAGQEGATIKEVVQKTPAADAGLEAGDVILEINGEKVLDAASMRQILNRFAAGDTIELTIRTNPDDAEQANVEKVELVLAVRPENDPTNLNPEVPQIPDEDETPDGPIPDDKKSRDRTPGK